MTADYAAEETIKGILEEEVLFSIPRHLKLVTAFMNLLPIKLQQDFRDIIVKDTWFLGKFEWKFWVKYLVIILGNINNNFLMRLTRFFF